jgi:hypothetical protein
MSGCIVHGRPVPLECAVIKVTMIREGCEFDDLDYPNEKEGIEKLKDAKWNFIIWPRKDIILKTRYSSIVLPQHKEDKGTPTSKFPLASEDPHSHHSLQ